MTPTLIALFLIFGAAGVVVTALLVYLYFPRSETRFAAVTTLLVVYAVLTLAPPVLLQNALDGPKDNLPQFVPHR